MLIIASGSNFFVCYHHISLYLFIFIQQVPERKNLFTDVQAFDNIFAQLVECLIFIFFNPILSLPTLFFFGITCNLVVHWSAVCLPAILMILNVQRSCFQYPSIVIECNYTLQSILGLFIFNIVNCLRKSFPSIRSFQYVKLYWCLPTLFLTVFPSNGLLQIMHNN